MLKILSKIIISLLPISVLITLSGCGKEVGGVLDPKGIITFQERQLLFDAIALMLIVVIPVVIMSFAFVWRYHHSHKAKDYRPNWCHNVALECIWWGVPCAIIVILGIMTWKTSHSLDPYRPIDIPGKPLQVQVVALPWKWLFIYPKQNIATVNHLEVPKDRQIEFFLTTDNVPMSAFFIPQLGSQIYTMAGMQTKLHLVGTHTGTFRGLNTQYNGAGFSDMHFNVKVVPEKSFNSWVRTVQNKKQRLDAKNYQLIRRPLVAAPVQYYSGIMPNLFKRIIKSYKAPEYPKTV